MPSGEATAIGVLVFLTLLAVATKVAALWKMPPGYRPEPTGPRLTFGIPPAHIWKRQVAADSAQIRKDHPGLFKPLELSFDGWIAAETDQTFAEWIEAMEKAPAVPDVVLALPTGGTAEFPPRVVRPQSTVDVLSTGLPYAGRVETGYLRKSVVPPPDSGTTFQKKKSGPRPFGIAPTGNRGTR
jgi:hypothetical protein